MSKIELINGSLADPVAESTKQCCRAYVQFTEDYPDYEADVKVCVYAADKVSTAQMVFDEYFK